MGIIDWPTPYASNVAMFKMQVTLPNGRGSTRRFNIPNVETDILGLSPGDKVSVEAYDKSADKEVSFDTKLRSGSSNSRVRFTIPLRQVDLEIDEFDKGNFHQFVLRKTRNIINFPTISPKRIYDAVIYKRSPADELNIDQPQRSNIQMSILKSQHTPLGIEAEDEIYVTMFRVFREDKGAVDTLKERLTSVNRSTFRAQVFVSGNSLAFNVPAKRRRLKDYEIDDVFQIAIRQ